MGGVSDRKAHRSVLFLLCCGLLFAGGCGCWKQKGEALPEVYTNRVNDTAYIDSILTNHFRQVAVGQARLQTAGLMTQCVLRVRAALPPDADEEALEAALEADDAWQKLVALAQKQDAESVKIYNEGVEGIRIRMLEEQQALRDVQAGKATAVDKPLVGGVRPK